MSKKNVYFLFQARKFYERSDIDFQLKIRYNRRVFLHLKNRDLGGVHVRWLTSIKWNGKEVQTPILRVFVTIFAVTLGSIGAMMGVLVLLLCLATVPVWLPIDFLLKYFGLVGFWKKAYKDGGVHHEVSFGPRSFRRATY